MKQRLTWLCSYLLEFTVCALCGWLYEEGMELAVYHRYADRGLLHLPLLPIYGFAGLLLILLFRRRNGWCLVFAASTLVITVFELAASYLLEYFGYVLWDYSAWPLHFEGRISLLSSLIFGVLSLILVKLVHPLCRMLYRRAPAWLTVLCGLVPAAAMAADLVIVLLK